MVEERAVEALKALMTLDLEYRLTIAVRLADGGNCDCAEYLVMRREVLIPEIMKRAAEQEVEPAELFHSFAVRLHERHEED